MAISLEILIKNGVQWGHQKRKWRPEMRRFIYGIKGGVHLIDVSKTAQALERATQFLEDVAAQGKQILIVGTKDAARDAVFAAAQTAGCPYVINRWIGGTFTNFPQVKKSVTKLLHYEDVINKIDKYNYTKKECGVFQKMVDRLENNVGGIRNLIWPVGALVVIDVNKEAVAIKEARAMGIPIVALVDTNGNPAGIDYIIPGNDDVARSIKVITEELAAGIARGVARADTTEQKALVAEQNKAEDAAMMALKSLESDEEGGSSDQKAKAQGAKRGAPSRRPAKKA